MSSRSNAETIVNWGWSFDPNPDFWFIEEDGDGFATREAALAAARAADDFDEVWLVQGTRAPASTAVPSCDTLDVGQWMEDFVADNYGEDLADGWPEISCAAATALNELLEAWADRWLKPIPWRATGEPTKVFLQILVDVASKL